MRRDAFEQEVQHRAERDELPANVEDQRSASNVRRSRFLWILVPLLLLASAGALWYQNQGEENPEKFLTAQVIKGDIEDTVSALGTVQPLQYVDVGTQVTGQLKMLHVAIGGQVKQGDLMAEIDPTLFTARVDATQATLENQRAQLAERQAQQRLAEQQHKRNKALFKANALSEEALQQSDAALEQAVAQVASLRAQIQQTQSQLKGDEANLRYTKIFAPMSGTVVSLTARQGQTLVASQQAPVILRIADLSTMTVWAQVSEADVPRIAIGMPVYFSTLGQPERRWQGNVRQILPTPETVNNVILYNVLFDVANPDQALKTQMSAHAFFILARAKDTLLVPASALQSTGKRGKGEKPAEKTGDASGPKAHSFIVRVLNEGRVEEREVRIGIITRTTAQVLKGLSEGETVIVNDAPRKDKEKPKSKELPRPASL